MIHEAFGDGRTKLANHSQRLAAADDAFREAEAIASQGEQFTISEDVWRAVFALTDAPEFLDDIPWLEPVALNAAPSDDRQPVDYLALNRDCSAS